MVRASTRRTLLAGIVLAALGWGVYWLVDRPDGERPELQGQIASAADVAGDRAILDLASIADFPWDRLHLISAYTPDDVISSELGFDWQPYSRLNEMIFGDLVLAYDERWLAVFVRGGSDVTGWLVFNVDEDRPSVGFEFHDVPLVLARERARFETQWVGRDPGTGKGDWLLRVAPDR
jgi:hypothetical protein